MSRVVISCLTRLKKDEVGFLRCVRDELSALGHDFVVLSPFSYAGLDDCCLHLPLDWQTWGDAFAFEQLPIAEAVDALDVPLWLRRVEHVVGDRHGKRDCLPLVKTMAGTSLALLRALEPGVFASWNPPDPTTGMLFDIARRLEIPAVGFERGFLPGTLNIDPDRYGISDSLVDLSWDDIPWAAESRQLHDSGQSFLDRAYKAEFSRYRQKKPDVLAVVEAGRWADLRPRVVVIGNYDSACGFSPGDSALQVSLPGYESGFDLARKVAISHSGISIFKPHPVMTRRLSSFDARGVSNLFVGTGSPEGYLEWADVVVSYGSMLEHAALGLDRPVVLAGRSSLFGKGIAYEALIAEELSGAIEQARRREQFHERIQRYRTFVGYLIKDHLVRFDSQEERVRGAVRWCKELHGLALRDVPSRPFHEARRSVLQIPSQSQRLARVFSSRVSRFRRKLQRIIDAIRAS